MVVVDFTGCRFCLSLIHPLTAFFDIFNSITPSKFNNYLLTVNINESNNDYPWGILYSKMGSKLELPH